MADFFDDVLKVTGNRYGSKVSDGIISGDVERYIDTGSYVLNALLSGDINGGLPDNKIVGFEGESSVGKTYLVLQVIKNYLITEPTAKVVYFESESALTKNMFVERGIPSERVLLLPVETLQDFRNQAIKIIDNYIKLPTKEKFPIMFCLDSLGNLPLAKEVNDAMEGKDVADMGARSRVIKGAFRIITLKLGIAKIPMLVTNHVYDKIGSMYNEKVSGGGSGLKYAASLIVSLSKRKEKDAENDVIGNIIHCKLTKARLTKENSTVDTLIRYDTGLSRYYGLVDLLLEAGIWEKMSTKIKFPDGTSTFEKRIYKNPEKYFTKDILDKLNEYVKIKFMYGQIQEQEIEGDENGE